MGNQAFVYRGRVGALVSLALLQAIIWTMVLTVTPQEGRGAIAALLLFSLCFLMMFGLLIVGRSDVVLSEEGIARVLWGWTWRRLAWSNVDRVTEFLVSKGNGRCTWALNLFPKVKPRRRFTPSGKVFFSLDTRNSPVLISELNRYIAVHGISLTVRHTLLGDPRPAKELSS